MKKLFRAFQVGVLAAMLLSSPTTGWARQTDCTDALIAGEKFKGIVIERLGGWGASPTATIEGCTEFSDQGRLLGYFLPVAPKGFIMVNLLTQMDPIKAFSAESDLDISRQDGFAKLFRDTMGATHDFLEKTYGPLEAIPDEAEMSPPSTRAQWHYLLGQGPEYAGEPGGETVVSSLRVGPLLQSSWHEFTPYNNFCPMGNGGLTAVGSVATATAQIMKFWNFPSYGTGSKTYAWNGDSTCFDFTAGSTLTASFADTYDWANMIDNYDGEYTATQAAAAAELSYEIGVAFETDYGVCLSQADILGALTVLPTFFRYAATIGYDLRSGHTAANWFKELRTEFDGPFPRPFLYKIPDKTILCDGYLELPAANMVHMIYGGPDKSYNTWYTVDSLMGSLNPTEYEYRVARIQPPNRSYISFIGADKKLRYAYWNHAGTVFTAYDLPGGGSSTHAPAMAVFQNRQYLAVKGSTNNNIYIKSRTGRLGYASSSWTQVPGTTDSSPSLISYNNRLYLFVKNGTTVSYNSLDTAGHWLVGWQPVYASHTDYRPGLAVFNNKLYYFETDNNQAWYVPMDDAGGWGTWRKPATGSTNAGPSPVVYNGSLWLVVRGLTGSKLWYATTTTPDTASAWSSWTSLDGSSASAPSVVLMPETNVLHLAVRGNTLPKIWHRTYNGATWSAWQAMDTVDPDAQSADTPTMNIFYHNEDY